MPANAASITRPAVIYVRISKDVAGESLGVARQEEDCRALAEQLGWPVSEVYVDNSVSATDGRVRPAYKRMCEAMAAGQVGAVIAWHPDRLYRLPHELEDLIKIADREHIEFATCRAGKMDLSTASGRLVASLLAAVSRHETELKGERQARKARQLAEQGKNSGGGTRPFGWAPDRIHLDPDEAAVVRELAARVLAGESLYGLATWLTDEGVRTSAGGTAWHTVVLKRMLTAPRVAGWSTYRGEVVARGEWEPILDEDTWRRVCERLEYKGPERQNRTRVALFARDLIECGLCGYPLSTSRRHAPSKPSVHNQRIYRCADRTVSGRTGFQKACGRIMVAAERLENDVAERVLARVWRQRHEPALEAAAGGLGGSPATALSDLRQLEDQLKQLGVDYADGIIGRPEFIAARGRLTERIEDARSQLATADLPSLPVSSPEALAGWWENATLHQRGAVVRGLIEKIKIGPHKGNRSIYDPTRVAVAWRP